MSYRHKLKNNQLNNGYNPIFQRANQKGTLKNIFFKNDIVSLNQYLGKLSIRCLVLSFNIYYYVIYNITYNNI